MKNLDFKNKFAKRLFKLCIVLIHISCQTTFCRQSQMKEPQFLRGFFMSQWFMLTLVGEDKIGIVAKVTAVLYENGCHLGEASMIRLGGNFTIMLMVNYSESAEKLSTLLAPTVKNLGLYAHVYAIEGTLHEHQSPDVRITVYGADRTGIVAQVTEVLANSGMNILNLESNIGGTAQKPFYIMHIEGSATQGISVLEIAIQNLIQQHPDLKVKLENIETLVV